MRFRVFAACFGFSFAFAISVQAETSLAERSRTAADALLGELALAKTQEQLRGAWNRYEDASGLRAEYDVILGRKPGTDAFPTAATKVAALARRAKVYNGRFRELLREADASSVARTLEQLSDVDPAFAPLAKKKVIVKFCLGYLPLGSQGPQLPRESDPLSVCLDSVAVANYDLTHAVVETAVWRQLAIHETDPNFDLLYSWILSHGLTMQILKNSFPQAGLYSDPAMEVILNSDMVFSTLANRFRTAKDPWAFITSQNLNLMLAFTDALGMRVVPEMLATQKMSDLLALPASAYKPQINQILDKVRNP